MTSAIINLKITGMNTIRKKFLLVLFFSVTALCLYSQDISLPEIDLDITVKSLAKAVDAGRGLPQPGTPVFLNGTVIERRLIDGEAETFSGELTIANGEWVSDEDVVVSKCIVIMNGPQFAETIPARRSRSVNPKEVQLNSEVLVYAAYLGYAETDDGPIAVLLASGIRKL